MGLIDFATSVLDGRFALQREAHREQLTFMRATREKRQMMVRNAEMTAAQRVQLYAGAEPGINRPYPNILSTPEDYKQAYERIVLIRAARQMEEDYGFFDGLLADFETFVVGDELRYIPNTGNPDADRAIRSFLEWQFEDCDLSGRLDLTKMAQLFVRSMKRDGECGVMPVDVGDSIKLHYYSGDCIGNPMIGANVGPNNYNGIITGSDDGRVVQYDLYKRIPKLNAYFPDSSVPADNFWHVYDPFRLQQYHGVSAFKNAIRDAFDIDQILEYTKLNIKWRSSQLPSVHTETGRPRGTGIGYFGFGIPSGPGAPNPTGSPTNAAGVPAPLQTMVDGVTVPYMKLDEKVMDYPHDFPNAQLKVSIEEFRRECCKGVKLPYEFAYRSESGGVLQRFWKEKAQHTFNQDKHLLRRIFLNKFKNRAIQKGIDTGFLDLSAFGNLNDDLARFTGGWQMGDTISVDYLNETRADILQMENGYLSVAQLAASNNRDLGDILQENTKFASSVFAAAQELADKYKVPINEVLPYIVKKFPNQPAAKLEGKAAEESQAATVQTD